MILYYCFSRWYRNTLLFIALQHATLRINMHTVSLPIVLLTNVLCNILLYKLAFMTRIKAAQHVITTSQKRESVQFSRHLKVFICQFFALSTANCFSMAFNVVWLLRAPPDAYVWRHCLQMATTSTRTATVRRRTCTAPRLTSPRINRTAWPSGITCTAARRRDSG